MAAPKLNDLLKITGILNKEFGPQKLFLELQVL
jgi:hypothetical protein